MKEKLTDQNIKCVLGFAENNMKASETARSMYFTRNSVIYHLNQVKEKTGLNPYNFYDLMKLVLDLKDGVL